MPEAEVEFHDGHSVHYERVDPDNNTRLLVVYKNGKVIGFLPYEGIVAVMWTEEAKPK